MPMTTTLEVLSASATCYPPANPDRVREINALASRLVDREVKLCVSHLVSTLAEGWEERIDGEELLSLCGQAAQLSLPLDDWEEAAMQHGMESKPGRPITPETARTYCEDHDLDPIQREVCEHWAVSDWLAHELRERGERVDTDFAGLVVWARTITGQGIDSDAVIQDIAREIYRRRDEK